MQSSAVQSRHRQFVAIFCLPAPSPQTVKLSSCQTTEQPSQQQHTIALAKPPTCAHTTKHHRHHHHHLQPHRMHYWRPTLTQVQQTTPASSSTHRIDGVALGPGLVMGLSSWQQSRFTSAAAKHHTPRPALSYHGLARHGIRCSDVLLTCNASPCPPSRLQPSPHGADEATIRLASFAPVLFYSVLEAKCLDDLGVPAGCTRCAGLCHPCRQRYTASALNSDLFMGQL